MIAHLDGTVSGVAPDGAVIDVGGVGLRGRPRSAANPRSVQVSDLPGIGARTRPEPPGETHACRSDPGPTILSSQTEQTFG